MKQKEGTLGLKAKSYSDFIVIYWDCVVISWDLIVISWDFDSSDFMGFHSDFMGFHFMGYEWDVPSGNSLHSYRTCSLFPM